MKRGSSLHRLVVGGHFQGVQLQKPALTSRPTCCSPGHLALSLLCPLHLELVFLVERECFSPLHCYPQVKLFQDYDLFLLFMTVSRFLARAVLKLAVLLPQPPQCWVCRCVPLCPACFISLLSAGLPVSVGICMRSTNQVTAFVLLR